MKQYNKKDLSDTIVEKKDMKAGDIGVVLDEGTGYKDHIVMKSTSECYPDLILSLTNISLNECWSYVKCNHNRVQLFKPGSVIRIVVK